MSSAKTYYITTPIYYVNGKPHIGSALTTICCDALARFRRMQGHRTWFLTGTDEQATKVVEAAEAAGVPTQQFVDGLAGEFRSAWDALHVAYDDFIRTTEPRHIEVVQEIFRRLRDTGDVYQGSYEGWYCVSDETFFRDTDVMEDRLCPNAECRKPLRRVQEESWFFRLSAYGDRLMAHIEANPGFLQPEFRRNEVIAFIRQGLRDMSITRSNSGWGIPVPDDPTRVIYVWFDALINYLAATGWPAARYRELWPADVHLMAKEIFVRFHATLWPATLIALGVELPETVYAHGWWVDGEGKKEGKRTGGLPHPVALADDVVAQTGADREIAIDAVRGVLLREMVFPNDTEFSRENFMKRYNTDLANDLGNLCNRTVTMVQRYFGGCVPPAAAPDAEIAACAAECAADAARGFEEFRFNTALDAAWRLVGRMNRYIEEKAPWKLAKQGAQEELATALATCLESIRVVSALVWPAMPVAAAALRRQIGLAEGEPRWDETSQWGLLSPGAPMPDPLPLFPRAQPAQPAAAPQPVKEKKPAMTDPVPTPAPEAPAEPALITIDDFLKVQLRVANVLAAEPVPNATKLLKLTLELEGVERTVLAGIAEMYQPDELVGRQVVVVANLQPRKMRGIESQGMILAADTEGQAILLQPETRVPSGSRVR